MVGRQTTNVDVGGARMSIVPREVVDVWVEEWADQRIEGGRGLNEIIANRAAEWALKQALACGGNTAAIRTLLSPADNHERR